MSYCFAFYFALSIYITKAPLRMRRANDPVREQAARNYAAVIDELKNKFKGLKEGKKNLCSWRYLLICFSLTTAIYDFSRLLSSSKR